MSWVAVVALVVGAVVVVWPGGGVRGRLAGRAERPRIPVPVWRVPSRRMVLGSSGVVVAGAFLLGGPVAGAMVAVYAGMAVREWSARAARRRAAAGRAAALDGLSSLVADLRAGVPPAASGVAGDQRITELAGAVGRLAEETGAPAADLLDRVEADARAADRAAKAAAAQAAGAQATAVLLAGLPVGGIGLGYAIGADPLAVLLRTPIGAVCALAGAVLQGAGFLWAQRLINGPAR